MDTRLPSPDRLPDGAGPGIVHTMSIDQQTPSADPASGRPPVPLPGHEYVPMREAERRLEATADALRKRIKRGQLRGWKPGEAPGSMWFVEVPVLPGTEPVASSAPADTPAADPDPETVHHAQEAHHTADTSADDSATAELVLMLQQRLAERDQDVEDWKSEARRWQAESDSWREAFTRSQTLMLEVADSRRLELATGGDTPPSDAADVEAPPSGFWARVGRWFSGG